MRRSTIKLLSIAAMICFAAMTAYGAGLSDYRERIEKAEAIVDSLLIEVGEETVGEQTSTAAMMNELKRTVPASEKIEWSGGELTTDNKWLHEDADRAAAEADLTKRAVILTSVKERLGSLMDSIVELENAHASARTKDDDKRKLGEILERPEYRKAPEPEESLFQRWSREFRGWLDSVFPRTPEMPATGTGLGTMKTLLQVLVYVLVIGLIGFLVYRLLPFFSARFGHRLIENDGDRVILGERVSANSSSTDLMAEAEKLARDGDLRGAIRKGYIALLCELSDRKLIGLARHKTNRDYLREIRKREEIFPAVNRLTSRFEISWYGLRSAEQRDWEDFLLHYGEAIGKK